VGSSGTNSFSDYPGSSGGRPSNGTSGGGSSGGGGSGGGGKSDKCDITLSDLALEEVALSEYFTKHKSPPAEKTKVRLREKLVDGRLAVETEIGEVIGYVPTAYNYLRQCVSQGWKYHGKVSASSTGKVPKVKVDLAAAK
jgi:hypothetical protein